ncbi:MAG: hypothetical protein GF364_06355, partial [Candidatus Lokiarchaeota archaeon]|nr:hypothetical protein [Candidatus Lokiarchaeota archaeon]
VYRENWSNGFLDYFKKVKGYELNQYLPILRLDRIIPKLFLSEDYSRIIYDYKHIHSELILNEFFRQFSDYCHKKNVKCRVQPYSAPTDLLKAYGMLDILEIEGFGKRGIGTIYYGNVDPRLASSAAHIYGKKNVSCESFTWLGEHFSVSLENLKREADQIILHGVNQIIYHGYPYSPKFAGSPGWVFYASILANHNNTWWSYIDQLNQYIARNSLISRTTVNVADFAVYIPLHDEWSGKRGIIKKLRIALKESGHLTDFDYINDDRLQNASEIIVKEPTNILKVGTGNYIALVLWNTQYIPLETAKVIEKLYNDGLNIILVGQYPTSSPGLLASTNGEERKVREIFEKIVNEDTDKVIQLDSIKHLDDLYDIKDLQKDFIVTTEIRNKADESKTTKVKYLHQKGKDADFYFVVNELREQIEFDLKLRSVGTLEIWNTITNTQDLMVGNSVISESSVINPFTGSNKSLNLHLQLDAYESRWIVIRKDNRRIRNNKDKKNTRKYSKYSKYSKKYSKIPQRIPNNWKVEFHIKKNEFPKEKRNVIVKENYTLRDWSADKDTKYFSGTAIYTNTFIIDNKWVNRGATIMLDLGRVHEIAEIIINRTHCGTTWYGIHRVNIKDYIKAGKNTIKIRVTNLLLNRVIGYARKFKKWKPDYYFVNITYLPFKPFFMKLLPSGLIGPVKIELVKKIDLD